MSKVKSDFKVFVSDEILDFRTLEEKYKRTSPINLLQRTQSQDAIDVSKRRNMPIVNRQVTSSENISKPLYNSATTFADKYRCPRLKARSKTVDPRFRKSRSPTHKELTGSQSTADIQDPSMPLSQAKKKPFSPSHSSLSTSRDVKKPPKYNRDFKETEVVPPVDLQHKQAASKEERESYKLDDQQERCNQYNSESGDEQKINNEQHDVANLDQEKCNINSRGDTCNISHIGPPEITEDEIVEDSESHNNGDDMELADVDKISPYWDDPRLLEKHTVMKPVIRSQPIKENLEIPMLAKDSAHHGFLVCRKCLSSQWISPEYKYDDKTEVCNSSLISDGDFIQREYTEKDEYATLVPYVALGTAVGILIISSIAWFVTQHVSWDLSMLWPGKPSSPPETSGFISIKNCGENILYWVKSLYTKASELILMSRSEMLNNNAGKEEPNPWWYRYNK